MAASPRNFIWYELMTSDTKAAEDFYSSVVGWRPEPFGNAKMAYTVMNAGDRDVAGIMAVPEEARQMGMRPMWVGYIHVPDVDVATENLRDAGGKIHREPEDIPEVGRFSVVADPQGAMFMLMSPQGPDMPPVPPMTPGHCGWHELYAADWQKAFDFYSGQFGWTRGEAMDMGGMGTYQIVNCGDEMIGAMMDKPKEVPSPFWQFYFIVDAIDAATDRIKAAGGSVLMGPHEVPGGSWIVQGLDPQGAAFALVAARR